MTHFLTQQEVAEFVSQVTLRPTLWIGQDTFWVRKHRNGTNRLAVKFLREEQTTLSMMCVKSLDERYATDKVDRYVLWLLSKFTGYAWRKRVQHYLSSVLHVKDAERHAIVITYELDEPPVRRLEVPSIQSTYLQNLLRRKA